MPSTTGATAATAARTSTCARGSTRRSSICAALVRSMRRSTQRVYVRPTRSPDQSPRGDHRPTVEKVAEAIPLFPLSHVLLPGMPLPLHIFEQRYRALLADITSPQRLGAFGVVALRRGTEALTPGTDGSTEVEEIGTLAEILEVQTKPDGSSEVLSVGSRRFRVLRLLP